MCPAFRHLLDSAKSGCASCFILWQVAYHLTGHFHKASRYAFAYAEEKLPVGLTLDYWHLRKPCCSPERGEPHRTPIVNISSLDRRTYRLGEYWIPPGVLLGQTDFVRNSVNVARKWPAECGDNHSSTCGLSAAKQLPFEVFDLGVHPSAQGHIRLHECTTPESGRYEQDSHCLGPSDCSSKTTGSNIARHSTRTPFSYLSRRFKRL